MRSNRASRRTLVLTVAAIALGCSTLRPAAPRRNDPPPAPDKCEPACDNLRLLDCPEGKPTAAGASCEEVCISAETSGYVTLQPDCVAKITSCEQIDTVCGDTR